MISHMISFKILLTVTVYAGNSAVPWQQSQPPLHKIDGECDPAQEMVSDEVRDFADQEPLTDMDMEEDAQILVTMLKHLPACMNTAGFEQLLHSSATATRPASGGACKDYRRR